MILISLVPIIGVGYTKSSDSSSVKYSIYYVVQEKLIPEKSQPIFNLHVPRGKLVTKYWMQSDAI